MLRLARAPNFSAITYGSGDPCRGKQRERIDHDELAGVEGCGRIRAL